MPIHLGDVTNNTWKLTRRSFLAACAAAGCSQMVRAPVPPEKSGETWALLSDVHISANLDRKFGAACMAENFRVARDELIALGPDRVLINGDIAFMRGRPDDYAAFLELSQPLREADAPLHLTLGNHDQRDRFLHALPDADDRCIAEKVVSSRKIGGRRWLFLDSLEKTQAIRGSLGVAQLAWLRRRLDADRQTPTIICLHHNPDASAVGLKDHHAFCRIVVPHRQVKLVLFGHTHIYHNWQAEGLHFVNQPALGFRLRPGTSLGWMCANFRDGGVRLTFRGISRRERDDGAVLNLDWRSDA